MECVPGFCPTPERTGPPSGVMFLSLGLIGVGCAGLRGRGRSIRDQT